MLAIPFSVIYRATINKICTDFDSQEEAQKAFDKDPVRYDNLDRDNDNQACEDLPKEGPSLFNRIINHPTPQPVERPISPTPAIIELQGEATVHVEQPSDTPESPVPSETPEPRQTPVETVQPSPTPVPTPTPVACVLGICL